MPLVDTSLGFGDDAPQTWDDSLGYVPAAVGDPIVNQSSVSWDPSAINPNAGSVDDLLKFGLARLIDAKTRPVAPENVVPRLASEKPAPKTLAVGGVVNSAGFSWQNPLLLGAAGVLVLVLVVNRLKKK
jgi:hypothetical protein